MQEQGLLPNVGKPYWPRQKRIQTRDHWNPTLRYVLVQDERALGSMIDTLRSSDGNTFSWDTETSGLKPELGARVVGHAFCTRTDTNELTGYYVPVRHIGAVNENHAQIKPEVVSDALNPLFTEQGEVYTHHGKFDRKMARADAIEIRRMLIDEAVEATIYDENEPSFALKNLAAKYCTPNAKSEEKELDDWMRKDARSLGLSFKKHSKQKREKLIAEKGLDGVMAPTYLRRFGYARSPLHLCGRYAIHDVFYTWWLRRVKYRNVPSVYPDLWRREHQIADILFEMEWHGLPADEQCIRDTHEQLKAAVDHWLGECRRLVPDIPESFSASDDELAWLFYQRLGMKPQKYTKKSKQPSTDKESRKLLEKAYPEHGETMRAVGELATVLKLYTTYGANFLSHYSPTTGTINPTYNQLERRDDGGVPVTGRLSSADPNAQNVAKKALHMWDCWCEKCLKADAKAAKEEGREPRKTEEARKAYEMRGYDVGERSVSIHRYFTVPDDCIRAYIDFSQIELRVLAWFCQDPTMLRAYQEGLDLHQLIADELGIERDIAKQVNFGNSYGMTEVGLALRMPGYYDDPEGTRERAKEVLKAYFARYSRILEFRRSFANHMRRNGNMFVNPFGRPRRIPDIAAHEQWKRERAERQMMSSIISGTSADLMKESMIRTRPIAEGFGGRQVQTIHDEIVFDLPKKQGWANTVLQLVDTMEDWPMFANDNGGRRGVPIKVSVELTTTTWEDKKEIEILPDRTFRWAA